MAVQTQALCRLRSNPDRLGEVLALAVSGGDTRSGLLMQRVCGAFDRPDERGRLQRAGRHRVLRALDVAGDLLLPQPRARVRLRALDGPVLRAQEVVPDRGAQRLCRHGR